MSSDYQLEDTIFLPFTTRAFATGIPTVLAGTPAIDIYEDVTATPIITGETLNVSLNSVAGFNMITVTATAGTGFGAGQSYTAIIQAGTVGGVSVVGEVVAHFTLDMSAAAKDLANGTDGLGALKTGIDAIPTTAMRGTDSAALATVCTEGRLAELDAANLPTDIAAIPTTAMRGTDSAALASVCTEPRLAELDAGNLPTDIAAIPTTAMRGTDSAALASVCTEPRLAELDAGNLPTDIAAIPTTAMRGTDGANTVVPDAAGTAPTAVENRQEMDANSTKLATIDNSSVEKNAAFSNFPFAMVLASDHVTPATGLTVTGQRRIDNGSFVNVAGTISEISNGAYEFDALAADTNGTTIMWRFSAATADDRFVSFKTAL